jgi:Na+:H+ antiporter, NhaA family
MRPIERFLHVEASSGVLLLASALVAMLWANSPWQASYQGLWHTPIGVHIGGLSFERSLLFWINDGLMVIFFFVVGLEIRREIHGGELSDVKRAVLPVAAAVGGMVVPAAIYLGANPTSVTRQGWGVPMATDIAFAVGVLALLGRRVPAALRVLLLALAIIDDIGAILVIAWFYSSGIEWSGLVVALSGVVLVLAEQRLGVRRPAYYVPAGMILWAGLYSAGVHPAIAGVILGLLTPVRPWLGPQGLIDEARQVLNALHPWVAYAIMPLFALANAGVTLGSLDMTSTHNVTILTGVALGLALGKPIGIFGASFLAIKLGLCLRPRGATWGGMAVVGCVGGIGFTMALFVAKLAFYDPSQLAVAKLGVLGASVAAGLAGVLAGLWLLPRTQAPPVVGADHLPGANA